jgi:transcription initiation factor TFIID subunit 5
MTGVDAVGATGEASRAGGAAATSSASASAAPSGTHKKKTKEVQITPDQISAFPTKKTPVMKVKFTRMNLVIVGGCYEPER